MCGECCRAGYQVNVTVEDIEKWKNLEKNELLNHIIINPQCISVNNNTEMNSEEGNAIKRIKKLNKNFNKKIEDLVIFINKNHLNCGKNCLRKNIKTIISNLEFDPTLVPKCFNIILEGLNLGLEYIIELNTYGACHFLSLNRCSINNFKPIACEKFPFTKDKCLRKDNIFLSICTGLKKVKRYKSTD